MITAVRFRGAVGCGRMLKPWICGLAFAATLTGCGSNPKPQIGAIEFTTASGAGASSLNSLEVNQQAYLVATVIHDDQFLGVSWTVSCGSAVPPSSGSIDTSCGTFSPSHTLSGPVPTYPSTGVIATYTAPPDVPKGTTITITAHATSLPSITSNVVLTIEAAKSAENRLARANAPSRDRL